MLIRVPRLADSHSRISISGRPGFSDDSIPFEFDAPNFRLSDGYRYFRSVTLPSSPFQRPQRLRKGTGGQPELCAISAAKAKWVSDARERERNSRPWKEKASHADTPPSKPQHVTAYARKMVGPADHHHQHTPATLWRLYLIVVLRLLRPFVEYG